MRRAVAIARIARPQVQLIFLGEGLVFDRTTGHQYIKKFEMPILIFHCKDVPTIDKPTVFSAHPKHS